MSTYLVMLAEAAPIAVPWLKLLLGIIVLGCCGAAWEEFQRPPKTEDGGVIIHKEEIKSHRPICRLLGVACICLALLISWWFVAPALLLFGAASDG